MNALVISDRPEIQAEFARRLNAAGFASRVDGSGSGLVKCDVAAGPMLVVADGLGASPWDLCRRIRSRPDGNLPLIWVVVDKDDAETLETALTAGADECRTWPLDPRMFDLHLAAAVRRVAAMEEIPRAKAALQESVERWTLAERGSHAGVWDAKPNGLPLDSPDLPVWYSASMKQLFGFSEEEFPNVLGSWMSRVHPDELPSVMKAILQSLADKAEFEIEYRLLTKQGEYRWFSGRGRGIVDPQGQLARIAGSVRDITENRRVADALRANQAALKREQELLRKLLDLHERDRQIVAYEIHDGMAQEMTAALLHLQAFQHVAAERLEGSDFDRGLNLLRAAVQEARRLISGLRPPVLDELGIIAAIEYLINETRPDVPNIQFVHHTKFGRLAPPLESAIFRIVQEALTNIRTHSGSRRAKVELIEHGQQLRLVVRDWGKGFDPAKVHEGRFGVQGIRQRVRLLGGRVVIDSRPGEGTTVVVDFPLILNRGDEDSEKEPAPSS